MAGTTFTLPNYTGEIINISPMETPFLTAISGLAAQNFAGTVAGAKVAQAVGIQWQTEALRAASDSRQRLEGADAPTATEQARSNVTNVLEIHQEALELSYTKLAAIAQYAATGLGNANAQGLGGSNPVSSEAAHQLDLHFKQIARDVEASFLTGTLQDPADNLTPRKTSGMLEAVSTNEVAAVAASLTKAHVNSALDLAWQAGGITDASTSALICNSFQKMALTALYLPAGAQPLSRTVGGVSVETIQTDFGVINVMLNRYMPTDDILIVSLEQCAAHVLDVPGGGPGFFAEPLAKTGSANKWQLYGEIGLEYGNELAHAKITNLAIV